MNFYAVSVELAGHPDRFLVETIWFNLRFCCRIEFAGDRALQLLLVILPLHPQI